MFEVLPHLVLFLVIAAFIAGVIDSIAGGGGLITVPALLLAGANPVEALATNKLQGTFGAATATVAFARGGHVKLHEQLHMAVIAAIAGGLGATAAHLIPVDMLRVLMPIILIAIALFFALKPGLSDKDRSERLTPAVFAFTAVPLVAAYDGFFGPGTGSFYMLAFVLLAGHGVLRATAHTKLLNAASNLGSLLVFMATGSMWWLTGLAMALGQVVGAAIGAKLAMRIGAGLIRPLLVLTSCAMAARLLWQTFNS